MPVEPPGPSVPLSTADLKDGAGGGVDVASTWRSAVKAEDAETETLEISTSNQRWVAEVGIGWSRPLFLL